MYLGGLGPWAINFEVRRAIFFDIIWYLGNLVDKKKVMILIYILTYDICIADVEN